MKLSVKFAQEKFKVLEWIELQAKSHDEAVAMLKTMTDKIINEMKGSITTITHPPKHADGKPWVQRVVIFPDQSTAKLPTARDLPQFTVDQTPHTSMAEAFKTAGYQG